MVTGLCAQLQAVYLVDIEEQASSLQSLQRLMAGCQQRF